MTTPGSKDGREEVQARTPAAQWVTGVESQKMKGSEFRACRHVGFRQGLGSLPKHSLHVIPQFSGTSHGSWSLGPRCGA